MDKNICNICGGSYVYKNGKWICSCCDNVRQDEITNEELVLLANAATKLRMADFDSAEELYLDFVKKYPKNSEGYWGLLLSKYGIKYEDDFDGKKIPTVYATSIESVLNDENYKKAIALADKETEKYYKQQANKFESIRQEWVEKASKEQPVDIFICYKDSDEEKDIARTDDSYEAQNLYTYLMSKGYSVFFSRESLRDKVAEKYEPYIFNALNTAHVMIVYSSSKEYLESTWVKNEWTRFLKKIKNKQKQENSLILAFDKMKPSDFPKVFSNVQCMNASQKTFYSDLEKHIQKVIKKATAPITRLERVEVKENVRHKRAKKLDTDIAKREIGSYNVEQLTGDEETQLKTAYKFLNRGLFADADEIITKILDKNSRNGQAILCKLLVNLEAKNIEELENHIDENVDFDELENSIGYSNKDVALQIISALKNACINEFNADNNEFALQLADFICRYNVEDVNFNNRINEVITHLVIKDEIECADKLVRTLLRTLTDNTDSYLEEVEKTIDIFKKQGHFDIASKYVDEYLEIYPTSHKMLWKKISIDLKCRNEVELTSNIFKLEDISVFEKILECTKAGQERDGYIEKLLNIIQKCAEEVTSSEDFSKCCDVFDKIIKYTTQDEKYVKLIYRYAENCQEKGQFTHAEKYYAIVIGEDEQNHNAYWKLLQSKLKVKNNKELIEQPVIITTLSEFHSAIVATGDDEKSADRYIDLKAKQLEYIEKQKILKAKKKHQRKVMSIFAACFAVIFAIGAGFYGWGLYKKSQSQLLYTLENGTYSVKAGKYYDEKYITIPATYNGKPVTEIDENAFKNKNVEMISIPNSIEIISNNAFYGCDNLTKVEYYSANSNTRALANSSSMEKIGDYAFYGCSVLENFELSNTLVYLGKYAFANCSSLNEITIPNSLENILEGTFKNAFNDNVESISIPKGVKYVGTNAFGCNVKSILVDERNSIPTDWATDWFGTSSESEVLWSIPLYFEYTNATGNIGKEKISVVYGKSYECPVPSRNGYSFAGWYLDNIQYTGPDGLSIANWNESSAITLKPRWNANNNTLVFNGNGATSGEMANQIIATDSSANLNSNMFAREGYTFAGWSTTSNGEVEYENCDSYTMGVNSSYNLYAVWTPNTNEIIFNPNGATSGQMANQQLKTGFVADLTANQYERNGYSFAGWSTTRDGNVSYINGSSYTMGPNSSYTLYAVWELRNFVCTLKLNGGTIDQVSSVVFNITSNNIEIKTPTKTGYTFAGWSGDEIEGTTMTYTIPTGTYRDLVIEANWTPNTNEIIFNGNGATSGNMNNQQIKTDATSALTSNEFEREGYTFVGWSTTSNGEVEFEDGDSYTMGTNSSYTLYAVWNKITYKINYVLNDGINNVDNISLYTIETDTFNLYDATREYYIFDGWYEDSHFVGEKVTSITKGTHKNITLYAKWIENATFISSVNDLKNIANDLTETYVLMNDIDLQGIEWTPIGTGTDKPFKGVFDGQDFVISNFKIRNVETYIGFFGVVKDASIKNVKIDNFEISRNTSSALTYAGGLVAYAVNNTTIENCEVSGNIEISTRESAAGGIVGYAGQLSSVSYCNSSVTITNLTTYSVTSGGSLGNSYVGGVVGCANYAQIACCYATETLVCNSGGSYAGGVVGKAESSSISNCYSTNNVSTNTIWGEAYSGGIIAFAQYTSINNCYTTGAISSYSSRGGANAAGIVGLGSYADVSSCFSLGNISAESTVGSGPVGIYARVGNIVAYKGMGTIADCYLLSTQKFSMKQDSNLGSPSKNTNGTQLSYNSILQNIKGKWDNKIWNILEGTNPTLKEIEDYYNIIYILDDGINHSDNPMVYLSGETLTFKSPNKAGYTFVGWYNNEEFLGEKITSLLINSNIKLYAKWEVNTNEIIFNGNGATSGNMDNQQIRTNEIERLNSNQFQRSGYTFMGWSTTRNGEVEYFDGVNYTMGTNSSYTLYAVWEEGNVYVIFDKATLFNAATLIENGAEYDKYVMYNDVDLENEEWTPIGITTAFDGIFDGNGFVIKNLKISSAHNSNNVGFFATNYGVICNLGLENINIIVKTYSTLENKYIGPIAGVNNGTIYNCYVDGGQLESDFDFIGGFVGFMGRYVSASEVSITDCYTSIDIVVSGTVGSNWYHRCGGFTVDGVGTISNSFSNCNITIDNIAGGEKYYSVGKILGRDLPNTNVVNCYYSVETIFPEEAERIKIYGGKGSQTNNTNFYNQEWLETNLFSENEWQYSEDKLPRIKPILKCVIVYNGNGATSGEMANDIAISGSSITLNTNTFEKEGYIFIGWSTTPDGSVEYNNSANFITNDGSTKVVLYAIWEGVTNEIIFNGNGATSGNMNNQQVKSGQTVELNLNQYSKEHYRFVGWSTTPDGEVEFEDGDLYLMGINSSYTLYAIWGKQIKYITSLETIRYDITKNTDLYTEYILMNDIDLNNEEWTPIGRATVDYREPLTFRGDFDGNGFVIKNLKITSYATCYVGLFGFSEGNIKNVKIENLNINLTSITTNVFWCGGIVGQTWGSVENCSVSGTITVKHGYAQSGSLTVGGIAGVSNGNYGKIINCYSNVQINVVTGKYAAAGGITGSNSALIQNCYSVGNVSAVSDGWLSSGVEVRAGGISGGNSGEISNCFTIGNISTQSAYSYHGYAGGIVATDTEGTYTNNYRSNQQTVSPTSPGTGEMITINQIGTVISLSTIKTSNFIFNTLRWSSDIWEITNGNLPTLKMEV